MDLPRVGGCLVRIARTFIREKLGSALRLVADVLGALDADLALIGGDGAAAAAASMCCCVVVCLVRGGPDVAYLASVKFEKRTKIGVRVRRVQIALNPNPR